MFILGLCHLALALSDRNEKNQNNINHNKDILTAVQGKNHTAGSALLFQYI
jgi:hypothetical protein